tara:strand:- start:8711 stop:9484 length:774 start_codon:yes stop_codon:yes gene_type:complete
MEFLPNLDIEEDLANLANSDDECEPVMDVVKEDLSMSIKEPSPMDIFKGKPTNGVKVGKPVNKKRVKIVDPEKAIKAQQEPMETIEEEIEEPVKPEKVKKAKKPLSDKQKAHLDRIRKLALEKKKEKALMRKEALKKVNDEYEAKKTYKKRTIKVNEKIEEPPSPPPNPIKQRVEKQYPKKHAEDTPLTDDQSFIGFMENMGKYQKYMINYQNKQNKNKPPPQPKPQPKPTPKPKPQPPPPHLQMRDNDPYADIFKW